MAKFTKKITEGKKEYTITVDVIIRKTNHEYFSVTYDQTDSRGEIYCCGAGHEYIRKYFGDMFDDVIPLHLANSEGVPMYALENGFYYLQHPEEFSPKLIANHYRISLEEVEELRKLSKGQLSQWIEHRIPIWKNEAEEIRAKYKI